MSADAINSEWGLNTSWTSKDLCERVECEGLMLTTIFPALDIVWNPSSTEDMQYFSEFMVDALETFQVTVKRDFALSIEPYVFMFNLSSLRDS